MGPPIFIGGRGYRVSMHRSTARASMGAADFHRRKEMDVDQAESWVVASMGPPIFIGGRREPLDVLKARAALQWGRRFSSAEGAPTPIISGRFSIGFNGAADFIGGRGHDVSAESPPRRGFNGAADFHRRKAVEISPPSPSGASLQWGRRFSSAEGIASRCARSIFLAASMGPPIFIGGRRQACAC